MKTSPNGSQDFLKRLREATGPDRDLDAEIYDALIGVHAADAKAWYGRGAHSGPTFSVDAALALVERKLPGMPLLLGVGHTELAKPWAKIGSWSGCDAVAQTLPLAILMALFTYLQEKDNAHE